MAKQSQTEAEVESPQKREGSKGGTYSVRSLERALAVLDCFDLEHPSWSLVELSRLTGLHKATAFRLVKTMEAQGFLSFEPSAACYRLGPSLVRLSYVAHSREEIVRLARPYLERLARLTGETTDLAVWAGDGVLFLDQVLTARPFKPQAQIGRHFDDLRNSQARVIAVFGREEWKDRLLAASDKGSEGEQSDLVQELARVRREGVAFDLGEHSAGICAVSAPVLDASACLLASISVVAPDHRFGPEQRRRHRDAVKQVALDLSCDLGYAGEAIA